MGKVFVASRPHTPGNRVREVLDEAENMLPGLRGAGPQVLELLRLIDRAVDALMELEAAGMDVRPEHLRLKTVQQRLRRQQSRFVTEVGVALQEERAALQPDRARWWWFLDEAVAQERKGRLRQRLTWTGVAASVLVVAWLVYDHLLAPPPEVRQAIRHSSSAESLVLEGDLRAALAEFEAAAALDPDVPEYWVWMGVLHVVLDEAHDAEEAFETARSLYGTDSDFLLQRTQSYLMVGDLDAASLDVEQAIREAPDSGIGYYVRALVAEQRGDYVAAIADLERAGELAREAGDVQLEGIVRLKLALMPQPHPSEQPTPAP
jgi:tetratricopeptide (TPR) repeat protein